MATRGPVVRRIWWGKLIGAGLGLLFQHWLAVIVGLFIGHQFDRGMQQGRPPRRRRSRRRRYQRTQESFFETTFTVMGHILKADGRVSEAEIRAARGIMYHLNLSPAQTRDAIRAFNDGKQPEFVLDRAIDRFRRHCNHQTELFRTFVEIQMQMALSDGSVSSAQRMIIWRLCQELGISRVELAQIEALVRAQHGRAGHADVAVPSDKLVAAYGVLGVEADAGDADVKTAYRRLMSQHHPDKLVAKGMPEAMLVVAKEKTREIRAAYDEVKRVRGMK